MLAEAWLAACYWSDAACKGSGAAAAGVAVQINGKVRAEIKIAKDAAEAEARELAAASKNVQKFLDGKEVKKFIYVPGRIINFVAK